MMINAADVVFLTNVFVWCLGLGVYCLSHFFIRRGKDRPDVLRSITGAGVVAYVCYSYIEVFSGIAGKTDLDFRHWLGLLVGIGFLHSSLMSINKSLDSRTDNAH